MITIRLFNTSIKIRRIVLVNIAVLWTAAGWIGLFLHPDRNLLQGIVIGFFAMLLLLIADFGHALAHIFSARRAGAPMDEIRVSAGMPRTIYFDDDVPPSAHIARALGGPAFSALGLLLSLIAYMLAANAPLVQELAAWSLLGHGFIFAGCLLPLPIVDGGAILKWGLVRRGMTVAQADRRVRQVNLALGVLGIAAGLVLFGFLQWIAGLIVAGVGGFFFAVGMGKTWQL